MNYLNKGINGYSSDDNLNQPIGYQNTDILHNHAYKIHVHKYKLKLCSDKTLFADKWPKINLKAIGQLVALERAFCHFLAFQYHASKGLNPNPFPLKPQDLFKIKMYSGAAGLRHYTEVLQQNINWVLGTEGWYLDQKSIQVFHNFLSAVIKQNYGGGNLKHIADLDFGSTILTRANGIFEVEQLNILKNIIAKTATPILRNQPALASFYHAYELDTQTKSVVLNVEVTATLKFPGQSVFVNAFYRDREMSLHRLFSSEMLDKMNCPKHTQDSQGSTNTLSLEKQITLEPLMNFDPPSPIKNSKSEISATISSNALETNPQPIFKRNAGQSEIKTKLNWDDVFGKSPKTVNEPSTSKINQSERKSNIRKPVPNLQVMDADILPGENSDDFFDSSLEYDESTIIIGENKNENNPVFPIPSQLTTKSPPKSSSSSQSQAPDNPCSFDLLSTSSDDKIVQNSQNSEGTF